MNSEILVKISFLLLKIDRFTEHFYVDLFYNEKYFLFLFEYVMFMKVQTYLKCTNTRQKLRQFGIAIEKYFFLCI
jgi:hypothetical protein